MKRLFPSLLVCVVLAACQTTNQETAESGTLSVRPLWQTDPVLTTIESVIYDPKNDVIYVSNINGDPSTKDGNGSIGKVGMDGKVIAAEWVKGMDAPKGLGLFDGKLYVADIDRIHEVDIATGTIANTYAVDSAQFLNDITVDNDGTVFVSDMNTGTIHMLEKGKVSKWLTGLDHPNGILSEGDNMMIALWNPKTLNVVGSDKQVMLKADSIENPDGIEAVGNGGYLVSSWNGMVTYVDPNGKNSLIIDTRADSISAADIEYVKEKNLLLVPTFFKNSVMAYEVKK
jgi:outer membrane protein assembly factor BamB